MLTRKPIFPNVIEINHQLGQLLGCNVYLLYDAEQEAGEWLLIDVGYDDTVDEICEVIRQLDFPFSRCQTIIATHADVDHVQGLAQAKQQIRTTVTAHHLAVEPLQTGDAVKTFASIENMQMPAVEVEHELSDGDVLKIGKLELEVWATPGHTDSQLAFRMGNLLFSGDNIFRDGCVGAIDVHHGSNLLSFIESLQRIKASDVEWLLPSHGPIFRKDDALLESTIRRLEGYLHMADFGTCAVDWPLMDAFESELADGKFPCLDQA